MTAVWVVEDEKNIRDLIQRYLEKEEFTVRTFPSAESVAAALVNNKPDMLILDIMLPGKDGLALCRKIREDSDLPIIFVSARGEEFDRVLGMELGADDYLAKPFSPRELIVRVKAIFRRLNRNAGSGEPDGPRLLGNITVHPAGRKVTVDSEEVRLAGREMDLFLFLAGSPNRPFSRLQLLEALWGYDYEGDERAVDDTVKRIRKKLRQKGARPELTTIRGYGYRLDV